MRAMRVLLCLLVGVTLLVSCNRPASHGVALPAPSKPRPSVPVRQLSDPGRVGVAGPVDPDPRVGAVFFDGGNRHSCTASVVHSKRGDLVLTAAHCLSGLQAEFVPGFAGNAGDIWTLVELYFDPRWLAEKDPHADYAFARVSGAAGGSLEAHVGSALSLATAPAVGSRISVIGYPVGVGGLPIGCQSSTTVSDNGFPSLPCEGLVDGTSGAPWISGSSVSGLIGGLEGGGCAENVSYSSPFDEHTAALLARAEGGGPGDPAPNDYRDPC